MKRISYSKLKGEFSAPSSKSELLRALLVSGVTQGVSLIHANNACEDALALINTLNRIGVTIEPLAEGYCVHGGKWPCETELNCGESGFLYRSLPFIASQWCETSRIRAEGSLCEREEESLWKLLQLCRAQYAIPNMNTPLRVQRSLYPKQVCVPNLNSSQPLSGLLLSLPLQTEAIEVRHAQRDSSGYVSLTLEVMAKFGVRLEETEEGVMLYDGKTKYRNSEYTVEGDWSGAALLLAAGAVSENLIVKDLHLDSKQPDRAIVDALKRANTPIAIDSTGIRIKNRGGATLHPFTFDISGCPDLAPALAVLAAQIPGESSLFNTKRLENKESNRVVSLCQLLEAFGVECHAETNSLRLIGGTLRGGQRIDPHNDHRIAMAGALLGTLSEGGCIVNSSKCVDKSYPKFWDTLKSLTYSGAVS